MPPLLPITLLLATTTLTLAQSPELSKNVTAEARQEARDHYQSTRDKLETFRTTTARKYKTASPSAKKQLLQSCRQRLETDLAHHFFPAWHGTDWDFNGISQKPGHGQIACGYFVSTCLVHTGVNVPRIKLAQQPSQKIITTFMKRSEFQISSGKSIDQIRKDLRKTGDGLYIVGLDRHVGFISVRGDTMVFVHSSYYPPDREVVAEPIDSRNPLRDSNYRVIGKLFSDEMLIKWLNGERFEVR